MLKDDISKLNKKLQEKNKMKQDKIEKRKEFVESLYVYKLYQNYLKKRDKKRLYKYDKKTKKIISKLPNKLIKYAKKCEYKDIYIYHYTFLISPYLYPNSARSHLDRRGIEIVKFLKENGVKYSLYTHNNILESCYTIRVYFG